MTDETVSGVEWAPAECTLPVAERPLRTAEFDALFASAVRRSERLGAGHLRLHLAGAPDLGATVRDLAARESQCCSFFVFTVSEREPGRVFLDVEVPARHVDVLDALADRAAGAAARGFG